MRHKVQIEVLNERFAADTFEVGVLASLRADFQLAHPKAFVVTSGLL
jgi:hypothetical protein